MVKMYQLQSKFLFALAKLIYYAHEMGYDVTLGRGREDKESNARHGGKPNSLHLDGLAQDLNFFKNGKWLKKNEELKIFSDYWISQGVEFKNGISWGDSNHFSIGYQGRA